MRGSKLEKEALYRSGDLLLWCEGEWIPPARCQNANALSRDVGGTRVEILTNLPVEELLRVSEGLHLDE